MKKLKKYLKIFYKKHPKRVISLSAVAIMFIVLMVSGFYIQYNHLELPLTKKQIEEKQKEAENLKKQEESKKKEDYDVLKYLKNTDQFQTGTLKGQLKYLLQTSDTDYTELLSVAYSTTFDKKDMDTTNLNGYLDFSMEALGVKWRFPMNVNDAENKNNIEAYLTVNNTYKDFFGMSKEQNYLYFNKNSFSKTKELVNKLQNQNVPEEEKKTFETNDLKPSDYTNAISVTEKDSHSKVYDLALENEHIVDIYNRVNENPDYKNNVTIKYLLVNFIREENLKTLTNITGQVATYDDYATDIYLEFRDATGSVIAIRVTFDKINNEEILVEKFNAENYLDFFDFATEFINKSIVENVETIKSETVSENSVSENSIAPIKFGDIYFTGADESSKKDTFSLKELNIPINVLVNFSDAKENQTMLIGWYYEDQDVPLEEVEVTNEKFSNGILKSSINFANAISSSLKGNYKIKVRLKDTQAILAESSFKITD